MIILIVAWRCRHSRLSAERSTRSTYACVYIYIYIYIYIHTHLYKHIYIYIHTPVYIYIYMLLVLVPPRSSVLFPVFVLFVVLFVVCSKSNVFETSI